MKKNEKQESSEKQEKNEKELKLTEQQIEDFTRLAELQKTDSANGKERRLITDAYKAFASENEKVLATEAGVRAGKLKVWIEVKRTLHAEIID